jgi:lycopene beta-cyclase
MAAAFSKYLTGDSGSMKYFGVLARFVVIPLLILRLLIWRNQTQSKNPPEALQSWPEDAVLLGHVAVAVAYTTPWDNYLVATNIWSYDPELVTGIKIGYVPIEEYSFFVLQSLLTGSWTQYITRYIPVGDAPYHNKPRGRLIAAGGLGLVWLAAVYSLLRGHDRHRYLGLILSWALPPIILQIGFGGDILWRNRRLLAASIIPATTYLGLIDSLAIGSGTWAITPEKTIRREVIDNLPFEELLFFFLTNVLLVFGVILVQSKESEKRLPPGLKRMYFSLKRRLLA